MIPPTILGRRLGALLTRKRRISRGLQSGRKRTWKRECARIFRGSYGLSCRSHTGVEATGRTSRGPVAQGPEKRPVLQFYAEAGAGMKFNPLTHHQVRDLSVPDDETLGSRRIASFASFFCST